MNEDGEYTNEQDMLKHMEELNAKYSRNKKWEQLVMETNKEWEHYVAKANLKGA
jgi:heat shock protein HspQ